MMTGKFFIGPGLRAVGVGLAILVALLMATESLPPVWDEGDSFARADSVLTWVNRIVTDEVKTGDAPWSEKTLQKFFPNTVSREGHPAGYVIVIAAGKAFCDSVGLTPSGIVSEKAAWRFGPILLWSIALAAAFYRLEKTFSLATAHFAVASILILPRVFVHSQIAFGDSILMSGWLLVWAFFVPALGRKRMTVLWGILLGFTMAAKFTGALAAIPFTLFAIGLLLGKDSSARRGAWRIFLIGFPTTAATFYLLNPPIWHSPLAGIVAYVHLNTHRGAFNIAIQFLGEIYNLDRSLPWWNPLFWTAVTVPVGLLASGVIVILFTFRAFLKRHADAESFFVRHRAALLLLTLNWATLIVVRMFPGLPVHDGVRLFVAAFPFFGILSGIGLVFLWERKRRVFRGIAVILLVGSASSLVYYFPQGLSYYNLLIGGLPGATRLGMEATYYWDGLDRDVVDFLHQNADKRPLLFSAASYGTLSQWRRWEGITPEIETITRLAGKKGNGAILTKTPFGYYLLQNRAGGLTPLDRWLLANRKPIWIKTAGGWNPAKTVSDADALSGWNPWDLTATPIIAVYDYSDFLTACRQCQKKRAPR